MMGLLLGSKSLSRLRIGCTDTGRRDSKCATGRENPYRLAVSKEMSSTSPSEISFRLRLLAWDEGTLLFMVRLLRGLWVLVGLWREEPERCWVERSCWMENEDE